ncbi:MAG: hypothetical protein CML03_01830 [Pseudooceanicola sp.]|nr:hypothetical protein [Pseudooceanicola sp.]
MKNVWTKNRSVYGARKLWHAMKREKVDIARCTVERLIGQLGIQGVRRGKKIKATHRQPADQCPLDKINRQFRPFPDHRSYAPARRAGGKGETSGAAHDRIACKSDRHDARRRMPPSQRDTAPNSRGNPTEGMVGYVCGKRPRRQPRKAANRFAQINPKNRGIHQNAPSSPPFLATIAASRWEGSSSH